LFRERKVADEKLVMPPCKSIAGKMLEQNAVQDKENVPFSNCMINKHTI
jgi:hypothetical protein